MALFHVSSHRFPNESKVTPERARFVILGITLATEQGKTDSNCSTLMGLVMEMTHLSLVNAGRSFMATSYTSCGFTQMKIKSAVFPTSPISCVIRISG